MMPGLGKRSASLWALFASEYLPYRIINVTIYLAVYLLSTYPKMSNVNIANDNNLCGKYVQ